MQASINMDAANWIAIWLSREEEHTWSKMNQVGINMAAVNLITIVPCLQQSTCCPRPIASVSRWPLIMGLPVMRSRLSVIPRCAVLASLLKVLLQNCNALWLRFVNCTFVSCRPCSSHDTIWRPVCIRPTVAIEISRQETKVVIPS